MAEFQEVIRQQLRMCTTIKNSTGGCTVCPISYSNNGAYLCCDYFLQKQPAIAETIIMKWAKENPGPRYPSWREWQKSEFPTNDRIMCKKIFMSAEEARCAGLCCSNCLKEPIPAHIAEKLGIQPIKEE